MFRLAPDNQLLISKKGATICGPSITSSEPIGSHLGVFDIQSLKAESPQPTIFLYERNGGTRLLTLNIPLMVPIEIYNNPILNRCFSERPGLSISESFGLSKIACIVSHVPKVFEIESKYAELYKSYYELYQNFITTTSRYKQNAKKCSDQTSANELLFVNVANGYK